jgi:hypothetical protein
VFGPVVTQSADDIFTEQLNAWLFIEHRRLTE